MIRSVLGRAAPVLLLLLAAQAAAVELPRRAFLGVSMPADRQSPGGATVGEVIPGGTAAALGIRPGDVIVRAGDRPVSAPADVVAYASTLRGPAQVALTVRRDGRELALRGPAAEWPRERYDGASVDYGAVPWRGGHLRDILITPEGVAEPPVVFLIQGFSCATIEPNNPSHAYRRLGEALLREGIAYYRVEKPGLGDSAGTPQCAAIDYAAELDAFRSAYRHLTEARGFAPERIFIFGHSLGGLQAPMLAAERAPRGVAVYGTVVRNWADYHRDISQLQSFLMAGEDPVEATRQAESFRDVFRRFYMEREAPAAIAASSPALATGLREAFGWDGGENVFGRHFKYDQDLAHLPLIAAWRDARTNVLSIYGESDLVALFDEDHRIIADLANFYRPGTGRYVEIPRTGHGMDVIGTRLEVRERTRAAGSPPQGEFNPEVARTLAAWIREAMARPPVASAPAAAAPIRDEARRSG
jgi:pimeloyl-ACP methyl ester carboxylesterase